MEKRRKKEKGTGKEAGKSGKEAGNAEKGENSQESGERNGEKRGTSTLAYLFEIPTKSEQNATF